MGKKEATGIPSGRAAVDQLDREIAENAGVLGALREDAGTKGRGTGASGYGSGGGNFGSKGEGGVAAVGDNPIILGALDTSLIDPVIKRNMSQIRYC